MRQRTVYKETVGEESRRRARISNDPVQELFQLLIHRIHPRIPSTLPSFSFTFYYTFIILS